MHMAEEQWLILVRIRCAEVRLEKGFSKRAGSHDYTGVLFDEKKYILDLLTERDGCSNFTWSRNQITYLDQLSFPSSPSSRRDSSSQSPMILARSVIPQSRRGQKKLLGTSQLYLYDC